MCNTTIHHRPFNGVVDPFSFSTFHLLRTCNRLMLPSTDIQAYYNIVKENTSNGTTTVGGSTTSEIYSTSENASKSPILDVIETIPLIDEALSVTHNTIKSHNSNVLSLETNDRSILTKISDTETEKTNKNDNTTTTISTPMLTTAMGPLTMTLPSTINILPRNNSHNNTNSLKSPTLPAFEYIAPITQQLHHHQQQQQQQHHHHHQHHSPASDFPLMELNRVGAGGGMSSGSSMFSAFMHRRPRGEKRPIPDEQKDEKYYERRKRNNEAAKKSRDARKIREDRIAFRAALLEQENSILRAQVMALRDELQTMRQLISSGVPGAAAARSSIAHI